MTKTALLATAGVLALTGAAYAGGAHPTASVSGHAAKHVVFNHLPGSVTLWDQNSGISSNFTSQNFEATYDQYDNQGADDFVVPKGHTWIVKEVDVTGQYRYSGGSADSANVFFYKNKKGSPAGSALVECDNVPTNDSGATGSFALKLPKGCKVKLGSGKYFVSVQANLDFLSAPAQWYWDTNSTPQGAAAAWQDPNGGWTALGIPSDCTSWQTLSHCLGTAGDAMFALQGKDKT